MAKFGRRFARSAKETPAVLDYYAQTTDIVNVDAAGKPEQIYDSLLAKLSSSAVWTRMTARLGKQPARGTVMNVCYQIVFTYTKDLTGHSFSRCTVLFTKKKEMSSRF